MPNTYTISIAVDTNGTPQIMGDPATGVIHQVDWNMTGTDGTYSAVIAGVAILPPIDPNSPLFVPLLQVTIPVLLQWASSLLDIPDLKAALDAKIAGLRQAAATQPAAALAQLQLAPTVQAQAGAGVPV